MTIVERHYRRNNWTWIDREVEDYIENKIKEKLHCHLNEKIKIRLEIKDVEEIGLRIRKRRTRMRALFPPSLPILNTSLAFYLYSLFLFIISFSGLSSMSPHSFHSLATSFISEGGNINLRYTTAVRWLSSRGG